jgi:hypothetical protein
MKLGEFLTNLPAATGSAKKERVEFTLLGMNQQAQQVETRGFACFRLVTDKDHEEADLAALESCKDLSQRLGMLPRDVLTGRERAHFLAAALRDYDDPRERFCDANQLQVHVSRAELDRLMDDYAAWREKNYPAKVTKEEREHLKQEALKK